MAQLVRLSSRMVVRRAMIEQDSVLSPTDSWLLRRLAEEGPARMSELAAWQSVDRSTMTVQVRRLAAAGLVERATDPQDRRAAVVSISAEGERVHGANVRAARALFADLVADWTPQEREDLSLSMEHLASSLEQHVRGLEPVRRPRQA